jgi:hypothetical protein
MSIKIGSNEFEVPFSSTQPIQGRADVYAIFTTEYRCKCNLIDVGESARGEM